MRPDEPQVPASSGVESTSTSTSTSGSAAGAPQRERAELDPFTLRRAAAGDRRAARAFVECYQRPVFAVVSRMLIHARPGEIDDLAQEVFLRAFRALPRFDPEGAAKPSTWLLTIATRACIDELRRRRPELHAVPIDDSSTCIPLSATAPDPAEALAQDQLRARLKQVIEDLPDTQRAAFVLFEFHGWSYREIADLNDQPIGTVRSRIARARVALQAQLEGDYHEG